MRCGGVGRAAGTRVMRPGARCVLRYYQGKADGEDSGCRVAVSGELLKI